MTLLKSIAAGVVAASLGLATTAQAAETRSFGAIPAKTSLKRSVPALRGASNQGAPFYLSPPFIIGGLAVIGGVILIAADNGDDEPDTP